MRRDGERRATLVGGEDCPLCAQVADLAPCSRKVAELAVSTLWLERDQRFRGCCILVFRRHASELTQLAAEETLAFNADLRRAAWAIERALRPDQMHYSLLGNTVPHLHWHIVPRYRTDPGWNEPHWADGDRQATMALKLADAEYSELAAAIRHQLESTSPGGAKA